MSGESFLPLASRHSTHQVQGTFTSNQVLSDLPNGDKFHADNLSSAHIYLRLQPAQQWDEISKDLIEDCAQLTKANSIEGIPPPPTILVIHS